jgi:hypothetical protein
MAPLLAPGAPDQSVADPWWGFLRWQLTPPAALLAELRDAARDGGTP